MNTQRRLVTAFASLAGLAALLVGFPLLLWAVGGNPLPIQLPALHQLGGILSTPDDGQVFLQGLRYLGWLLWLLVIALTILEVAAQLSGRTLPKLPGLRVPQLGIRHLVAGVMLIAVVTPAAGSTPRAQAAPPTSTPIAAPQTVTAVPHAQPPAPSPNSTTVAAPAGTAAGLPQHTGTATPRIQMHTVELGDSLWSVAEQRLGDGARYDEILQLNPELGANPDFLMPGIQLRLPAEATSPHAAVSAPQTHVVRPGETLSEIAQEDLGDAGQVDAIAAASRDVVHDPNLIHPGDVLHLPTIPADSPAGGAEIGSSMPNATGPAAAVQDADPASSDPGVITAGGTQDAATPAGVASAELSAPATLQQVSPPSSATSAHGPVIDAGDVEPAHSAWLVPGLLTGGGLLAAGASALLAVRRRRAFRQVRPGRVLATPSPELAPVEQTLNTVDARTQATMADLHAVLAHAAGGFRAARAIPQLLGAVLEGEWMLLRFAEPVAAPAGVMAMRDGRDWLIPASLEPDALGERIEDAAMPWPLLAPIGETEQGAVWLLNLEQCGQVIVSGDPEHGRGLARYLAASIATQSWSQEATVSCLGLGEELRAMNPTRFLMGDTTSETVALLEAQINSTVTRCEATGQPTAEQARELFAGDDVWPAHLVVVDEALADNGDVARLRALLTQQHGRTGTALVVEQTGAEHDEQHVLAIDADGQVEVGPLGVTVQAVHLSTDEAAGLAALLGQAIEPGDRLPPASEGDDLTTTIGTLQPQVVVARDAVTLTDSCTLLPAPDTDYERLAAVDADELQVIAPRVPHATEQRLMAADPDLDADVEAWFDPKSRLPKLRLLGPVRVSAHGAPLEKGRAYMTDLIAYLATRRHGATMEEIMEAMGASNQGSMRAKLSQARRFLGADPLSPGHDHMPPATQGVEGRDAGVGVYHINHLLCDADLFTRLHARAQARGEQGGIEDLETALRLVEGRPFDQLRPGGWNWALNTYRHLALASEVSTVAHLVVTHCLAAGELERASAALQTGRLALPDSEVLTTDWVKLAMRQGARDEAERIVRSELTALANPDEPDDLAERTQRLLNRIMDEDALAG